MWIVVVLHCNITMIKAGGQAFEVFDAMGLRAGIFKSRRRG
jgi:hypothetical protein